MSKTTKVWLITAASLAVLGLLIFTGVMTVYGWDFSKLGTVKYTTNLCKVSGDFEKISIDTETTEIEFLPSEDGQCRISFFETEKVKHSATVREGTLVIDTVDERKWYDSIGIFWETPKMTVYLPQEKYSSLVIDIATGDIEIPADFVFESIRISGGTGDVKCLASVSDALEIELSTGDIELRNISAGVLDLSVTTGEIELDAVSCRGDVRIGVSTGDAELDRVSCKNFTSDGSTGDLTLKNVVASEGLTVRRSTGDVRFEHSDAAEISVKTSTGSVTGILLTEKIFKTDTSAGRVRVPQTTGGGKCEIVTSTGNIEIEIP